MPQYGIKLPYVIQTMWAGQGWTVKLEKWEHLLLFPAAYVVAHHTKATGQRLFRGSVILSYKNQQT